MERKSRESAVPEQLVRAAHIWWVVLILLSIAGGAAILLVDPVLVFGFLGGAIFTSLIIFYPFFGILAYFVFEYARLPAMFPVLQSLQLGKLIVIPTLVVLLVRYAIFRYPKIVLDKINLLFLVWSGLAFASISVARDAGLALDQSVDLVKWFITCFLIVNLINDLRRFQWVIWVYLLLNFKLSQFQIRGFVAGYSSAYDSDFYIRQGVGGGGSFFGNATDFGLAMAIVLPLAFYLFSSVRSIIHKIAAGTLTVCFITSVLMSGSRGAALAMFACGVLYWKYSKNKLVSLVSVLVFIACFLLAAPDSWRSRFISSTNYEEDPTAAARIELWKGGMAMFFDHPILGVGISNFSSSWTSTYRPSHITVGATVPHNVFIQAISELGLGGLFVVIAIIYVGFKRNQETRRIYHESQLREPWILNLAYALDMSILAFVVGGMFLTILYFPHLYVILGLTIALNQIARSSARDRMMKITQPET